MASSMTGIHFGLEYADGSPIKEGDIVWYCEPDSWSGNVVVYFYWDASSFSFKAKPLNERVEGSWALNGYGDSDRKYNRLGSIYDSPIVLPLWKKAGELEAKSIFMKQAISSTCFPLAAINASIGLGVEKAILNFDLLKRLAEIGECRKWGGCIDEQAVLNAVQAELDVTFVLDDYTSTVETGGIVTVADGAFHAVASVVSNGHPFLVNMTGYPFVVPASCVSIPRSDNADYHRDYTVLKNS